MQSNSKVCDNYPNNCIFTEFYIFDIYRTQTTMSKPSPQLHLNPTRQTVSSLTPSTLDSQPYSTLPAHFSTDLSSADALEELLQQVGLSSNNLLATQEQCESRQLLPRPPPEPWEPTQPSETKRNKRGRVNAPRQQNGRFLATSNSSLSMTSAVPTTSEQASSLKLTIKSTPYENLPPELITSSPYVNVPTGIITSSSSNAIYSVTSSNSSSTYTYSDTLLPSTPSYFAFPSSEQLASDLISFLVQAAPQPQSASSLHLLVLENTLRKHFYSILISHIDSLYITHPNRNFITFEFIIRNCLSHLGIT